MASRFIPFGYQMLNGKIMINEQESTVVKQIFRDYANGKSFGKIAVAMTIPYSEKRTSWGISNVARILENERYTGINNYPRIIEKQLFKKAVEIRNKQKERCKRKKPKQTKEPETIEKQDLMPLIMKLENTINRALSQRDFDYEKTKEQIFELASLRYSQLGVDA